MHLFSDWFTLILWIIVINFSLCYVHVLLPLYISDVLIFFYVCIHLFIVNLMIDWLNVACFDFCSLQTYICMNNFCITYWLLLWNKWITKCVQTGVVPIQTDHGCARSQSFSRCTSGFFKRFQCDLNTAHVGQNWTE